MELSQYKIVLVKLDPAIGSEMKKTRPCVILSPNEMNNHLRTIVIATMTSTLTPYPSRIKVFHKKNGMIALDQIRTVDRQRIVKTLGSLTAKEIAEVKEFIKKLYVD